MNFRSLKYCKRKTSSLIQGLIICFFSIAVSKAQTVVNFSAVGSNTWICPPGVTTLTVECWGGGGGGGGDNNVNTATSGGGGGGGCSRQVISVTPGVSYAYTVGGGGLGGSAAGFAGSGGIASKFSTVTANPGLGGAAGTTVNGSGGSGGSGTLSNGSPGGIGATSLSGKGGNSGIGSTSGFGASSVGSNLNGMSGGMPGGGGSGANHISGGGKTGGNGGNGLIKIAYFVKPFITTWDLSISGSGPDQLSFGAATSGTVSYNWQELSPGSNSGTGTFSGNSFNATGLPANSIISLSISVTDFQKIIINNGADKNRLQNVENWGGVAWIDMGFAFAGCSNLNISATDIPDLSAVTSMNNMFQGCTSLNGPANINLWKTSTVTTMSHLFDGASLFDKPLNDWKTSNVNTMDFMFNGASSFNQNIGAWSFKTNVVLNDMLNNSGLNCDNYSATLIGWSAKNPSVVAKNLGAVGLQFGTNAVTARNNLTSSKTWTITGDSPSGVNCAGSSPYITINSNFSPFTQQVGTPSTAQSFLVSGSNLINDVIVMAPPNYEVSLVSGSGFTNSVSLSSNMGAINNATVFVRLNAGTVGVYNSLINVYTIGTSAQVIPLNGQTIVGSANVCNTAFELCFGAGTVFSYPAAITGSASAGPNYGCLATVPNPTWFYFKTNSVITNSITQFVLSSSAGKDMDYILWGPIGTYSSLCSSITNSNVINGCSYSASITETVTINSPLPSTYYMLMITNYSASAHDIIITCTQGVNNVCESLKADFSLPTSVCLNQPVNINDLSISSNGAITAWSYNCSAASPTTSVVQNPTFTFSSPGSYPITLTVYSGTLSSTSTKTITVNPNPTILFSPTSTVICQGQSLNYNLSGATSYTSSSLGSVSSSYSFFPSNTVGTESVTGTDINGCTGLVTASFSVVTSPTVSITSQSLTSCSGYTQNIVANGANNYIWFDGTLTNSTTVQPTSNTTYSVIGTNNDGCKDTAYVSMTVNPNPIILISPTSASVCSGQSVSYSLLGANTYTSSLLGSVSSTYSFSPSNNFGTELVTGTGANGCIGSATASFTIVSNPTVAITSQSLTSCYGYTQTITANGTDNYLWYNGATTNTIIIQPITNATYSVIGTNNTGCKDTAYVSVTVLQLPNVTAVVSETNICSGENVNISATGNATNYLWLPGNLFGSAHTVTLTTPTTFTLLGQGLNGCSNASIAFVDVKNKLPITPLVNPVYVCVGSSVTLSIVGGVIPAWASNTNTTEQVVFPNTNTTYTYLAYDANNCEEVVVFNTQINSECDLVVYNGFTPNNDGVNDTWWIDQIEKINGNKVTVYNRWGIVVFETQNYDNTSNFWDGTFEGNKLQTGTYFFTICDKDEKVLTKNWIEITY